MKEKIINLNIDSVKDFYKVAISFNGDIDLRQDKYIVDGKSLMGVYTLSLNRPIIASLNSDDINECNMFDSTMEDFK